MDNGWLPDKEGVDVQESKRRCVVDVGDPVEGEKEGWKPKVCGRCERGCVREREGVVTLLASFDGRKDRQLKGARARVQDAVSS